MMPHPSAVLGSLTFIAGSQCPAADLPRRAAVAVTPVMRVLPGIPASVSAARQLTRQHLGRSHPAADTAMLLMSELVTNSVTHSKSGLPGGTVTVAVCAGQTSVLIQVRDDGGPGQPRMLTPRPTAEGVTSARLDRAGAAENDTATSGGEHGYGLLLVDALAETWGTISAQDGRVTWCRLAVDWPGAGARSRGALASTPETKV